MKTKKEKEEYWKRWNETHKFINEESKSFRQSKTK